MVRTGDRVRLEIREEANIEKVLEISLRGKVKVVSLESGKDVAGRLLYGQGLARQGGVAAWLASPYDGSRVIKWVES